MAGRCAAGRAAAAKRQRHRRGRARGRAAVRPSRRRGGGAAARRPAGAPRQPGPPRSRAPPVRPLGRGDTNAAPGPRRRHEGGRPATRAPRVLDVGGGSGRFLTAFAARHPDAELHLFDLPAVAAVARQRLPGSRNGRRIAVHEGDFFTDPLPQDYDLATLVRIVHDHDDESVVPLLTRLREGLRPGGVVMIAEPMSGDRHSGPVADAYFGFYLRAMGSGRPRTPDEIAGLMKRAGLTRAREIPTSLPVATKIVAAEIPRRSVAFS
ncbi:methyltransferase [Aurantimonas aggregata]|uniref:methyltransferase n=1 Tax=Aurantimonas aggregata TaxID=2047720 RepID=UPI0031B60AA0